MHLPPRRKEGCCAAVVRSSRQLSGSGGKFCESSTPLSPISTSAFLKGPTMQGDIDDPDSWPLESLRDLDSSLRCPICAEIFETPVALNCEHHCACTGVVAFHCTQLSQHAFAFSSLPTSLIPRRQSGAACLLGICSQRWQSLIYATSRVLHVLCSLLSVHPAMARGEAGMCQMPKGEFSWLRKTEQRESPVPFTSPEHA